MTISEAWLLRVYGMALHLYPARFRRRYGAQMIDAARLAYAESEQPGRLVVGLILDTVRAATGEHLRAASLENEMTVAGFGIFFTLMLLVVAMGYQQVLRRGADRAPERLVSAVQRRAAEGVDPAALVGGRQVEIASADWLEGAEAFTVVYDARGRAVAGDATLHGALPQPPAGIFDHLRAAGHEKVTWQPDWKIRVALVGQRLPDGGFVLAGQSLIRSETREIRFHLFLIRMWEIMIVVAVGLSFWARFKGRASAV